jgi:CBS domain-containing protein
MTRLARKREDHWVGREHSPRAVSLNTLRRSILCKDDLMQVRDVMTSEVVTCTPDESLQSVAQKMMENDCGSLPVVESEANPKLVGIVTDRDIVCRTLAQGVNPLELSVRDAMTEPCSSVGPDVDIDDCCTTMEDLQVRRIPVTNESGMILGIVAQADIAKFADPSETAELVKEVSEPA